MSVNPTQPVPPVPRTARNMAKATNIVPYWLEGDPDLKDSAGQVDYLSEGQYAVAVGPLKYRHYLNYINIHGEALDNTVNKILFVFTAMSQMSNPNLKPEDRMQIESDEHGRVKTPFGVMHGNLEQTMVELAAFIMGQHGRIVGVEESGKFKYEGITPDQVIDHMDLGSITDVAEDSNMLFFEILELSNVWNPKEVIRSAQEQQDAQQAADDELKNSPTVTEGESKPEEA